MDPIDVARTCGAQTGDGTPCRRYTIRGGTRCSIHGGASPQARRVAEEMLAIARLPAARALLQVIEDWNATKCETCGHPTGDAKYVINAAKAVLDRSGLPVSVRLEQEHRFVSKGAPWADWLLPGQLEQISEWMLDAKQRMSEGNRVPQLDAHVDERPISDWLKPMVIEGETIDAPREDAEPEL